MKLRNFAFGRKDKIGDGQKICTSALLILNGAKIFFEAYPSPTLKGRVVKEGWQGVIY